MNWIDAVSLGLVLFLMGTGAWAGLIKSIFRLLSVVAASFTAWYFSDSLALELSKQVDWNPMTIKVVTGSTLFILTLILVLFIGNFLSKIVGLTPAGLFDRLGGAGLGFLKASLIILVIGNLLLFIPVKLSSGFGNQIHTSTTLQLITKLGWQASQPNWEQIKTNSLKRLTKDHLDTLKIIKPSETQKKFDF